MRILVIDEDEVLRQVISGWLRRGGHTVRGAASARAALALIKGYEPTLAIVGMDLPDRSGLGLVREIRRSNPKVSIIASGEEPSVRDLLDLVHLGVLDFLELPFSAKALETALRRVGAAPPGAAPTPAPHSRPNLPDEKPRTTLTRLLSTGLIKLLKEGRVQIPVIAPMAQDIQRLLAQPTCGTKEIIEVIQRDPAVVRGVIKTASSSFYRGRTRTVGLDDACNRLGNRRVLGIAQRVIVSDLFTFEGGKFAEVVGDAWRNLIVTAHGARVLAVDVGHEDPESVYVAALFHNIGEVVLLRVIAERLRGSGLGAGVEEHLGGQLLLQHESVGRMVMEGWGMPPDLVRLAGSHHLAPRAGDRSTATTAQLCMTAWTMAIERGFTYIGAAGNVDPTPWLSLLGLKLFEARRLFQDARRWVEDAEKG